MFWVGAGLACVVLVVDDPRIDSAQGPSILTERSVERTATMAIAPALAPSMALRVDGEEVAVPEWWIGVSCEACPKPLQRQLKIDHGLLVGCVAPGSPAARADFRVHDVLLSFDGVRLRNVEDLVVKVESSQGRAAAMELVRNGESLVVTLAAEKRPPATPIVVAVDAEGRPLNEDSRRLLAELETCEPTRNIEIVVLRPGILVERDFVVSGNAGVPVLGANEQALEVTGAVAGLYPGLPGAAYEFQAWQGSELNVGPQRIRVFTSQTESDATRTYASRPAQPLPYESMVRLKRVAEFRSDTEQKPAPEVLRELEYLRQRTEMLEAEMAQLRAELQSLRSQQGKASESSEGSK